jgi:hypothetical protein
VASTIGQGVVAADLNVDGTFRNLMADTTFARVSSISAREYLWLREIKNTFREEPPRFLIPQQCIIAP